MKRTLALSATLSAVVLATLGCGVMKTRTGGIHGFDSHSYQYSATASVGDFVDIVVDETAQTIAYNNLSTGESGVAHFRVMADGTYRIDSDTGTMSPVMAYEVPGYAFIMAARHTGAGGVPSIITSVHTQSISTDDLPGEYNYMQFRTNSGGVEIGDVHITADQILPSNYGPRNGGEFNFSLFDMSDVTEHGTYMSLAETDDQGDPAGEDIIFRTTDGFFAVDTPNGGLVCLQKAATKYFDPANVGSYHAMVFGKNDATTGFGNVETPVTGMLSKYAITVANSGSSGSPVANVTVVDGRTTLLSARNFSPLDDDAQIHDGIGRDCPGAFIHKEGDSQYFLIFLNDALLISYFKDHGDGTYDYWYGCGLRDAVGTD